MEAPRAPERAAKLRPNSPSLNPKPESIMPTSTFSQIPAVVKYLETARPASILDIGVGNGKMGFMARDFLDVMLGERYKKEDWKTLIDGIEVFPDYIQEHQNAVYDNIFIGDAMQVIDGLGEYEMIIIGDVLEHFEKADAWRFLDKCSAHCSKYLLLSIPLGEKWIQPEIYGNPHEEHLSFWKPEEFEPFADQKTYLDFPGIGLYGSFLIAREDYLHFRVRQEADSRFATGDKQGAVEKLEQALKSLPPNLESEFLLAEFLIGQEKASEALQRLNKVREQFPLEPGVESCIEQLANALNQKIPCASRA